MRVTDRMGIEQTNRNLQRNRSDMSDLQMQASTQKRVNKPSDDPIAAARVLATRTDERGSQQFLKNIHMARSFLEFTDQSLGEMTEVMNRLKELAIQQANDAGASDSTRRVVAEEVGQMYGQVIQIGNRKLGERYIFGGYQTVKPPFDVSGGYAGDNGNMHIHINKDAFMAMNVPGDQVFMGKDISDDGLIRVPKDVPRDVDTLRNHQEDDLEQLKLKIKKEKNPDFLMRAPAPDSSRGQVTVESRANQVDQQGVNILQTVKDFEIALRTGDKAEIQSSIDVIDQAMSQVIRARSQVGARIQTLNHTDDSLRKSIVENKMASSHFEDADLLQVVSDINKTDTAFKATLDTSARLVQRSLLDFLK